MYQRNWSVAPVRSHSMLYRWNPAWQVVTRQGAPPLFRPSGSWHGPLPVASQKPQCSTLYDQLRPCTFSMMSNSPMRGQDHRSARLGLPSIQKAGQYPNAAAPVTLGICTRLSTCMMPPAGGLKLDRVLSTLADVQPPEASRCGVMYRLPLRTSTLFGLSVITSISPVPKLAGPPGYDVPRVICQFAGLGRPLP